MGEGGGLMAGDGDRAWSWTVYWLGDGGTEPPFPTILASISPVFPGLSPP